MTDPPVPPPAITTADCPFCKRIEAGQYDYDDIDTVAFEPLNPVTPGHFLVVPRQHVTDAKAHPLAASRAMHFAAVLAGLMELDACNFISSAGAAATQTVYHLHVHVVPRREGDGLALPWNPEAALPHLAAAATDELKANLQAAIERVEHTAAAAQAKTVEHAVAAGREACAQLALSEAAKRHGSSWAGALETFAALLREAQPCCDLHGRNCEPPSELCCERCTEADHPGHTRLGPCSNPDLSPNELREARP